MAATPTARCIDNASLQKGTYRLAFDVAGYFRARGVQLPDPPFLDQVSAGPQPGPVLRRRGVAAPGARRWRPTSMPWRRLHAAAAPPVALFGGGHVGRAIVRCWQPLPFAVRWVDSRDEVFPADCRCNVQASIPTRCRPPWPDLPRQRCVLVMSFSHAEDLEIIAACLRRLRERGDLPYIGLIGSRTKWATLWPPAGGARLWRRRARRASPAPSACPASPASSRRCHRAAFLLLRAPAVVSRLLETCKHIFSTGPTCCCAGCM
jgi:hypothetical protein